MKPLRTLAAAGVVAAVALTGCSGGSDENAERQDTPTTIDTGGFDCTQYAGAESDTAQLPDTFRAVADATDDPDLAKAASDTADAAAAAAAEHPGLLELDAEAFGELGADEQAKYTEAITELYDEHGDDMAAVWEHIDAICGAGDGEELGDRP